MPEEIQAILVPGEQVVRHDVINRKLLWLSLIFPLIIIGGITLFVFGLDTISYTSNGVPGVIAGSKIAQYIPILGIIPILAFITNYVKRYVITNKRVLIKSGVIGTDFKSIYFTEIKAADVDVGLIGKIYGVGTISIDTGKVGTVNTGVGNNRSVGTRTIYDKLLRISNPYDVYKHLQSTLTTRQESLYSGRADQENIQATNKETAPPQNTI